MKPKINLIAGLWKFKDAYGLDKLKETAKDLEKEDSGHKQLFIRRTGEHEYGIAFIYKNASKINSLAAEKGYLEKTSKYLKEKAGSNLIGWDLSAPVWIIK